MAETSQKTVVIVEDDESIGNLLLMILRDETPYTGMLVETGRQALHLLERVKADLLVLDFRLPDMTGLDVFDRVVATAGNEGTPAILTSAHPGCTIGARKNMVFLAKPFDLDVFLHTIGRLLG